LVAIEDARKLAVRVIDFGVVGELGVQEVEWLPDYSNRWFVFHTYSWLKKFIIYQKYHIISQISDKYPLNTTNMD
jgi:hypothetical protein